ncbi:MAG: aromatic amino acid lyase [Leptospira sp.]|nr:aromatic amino acid lyase [Leptospira sp.]
MNITFPQFLKIAYQKEDYSKNHWNLSLVQESYKALQDYLKSSQEPKLLYGVDTSFGPHAFASTESKLDLQKSLIHHLSVQNESSPKLDHIEARAVLLARIHVLTRGYSGVSEGLLIILQEMLNKDVIPIFPLRGSLGASGDLIPLSSIGRCMMGESLSQGKGDYNSIKGLPRVLDVKEGIALTNGTSFMVGTMCIHLHQYKVLVESALNLIEKLFTKLPVFPDAFHPDLAILNSSQGMKKVSDQLYKYLLHRTKKVNQRVQDSYIIRALPQIFGAIFDEIDDLEVSITKEINTISDNPVYSPSEKRFIEAAMFYGSHISSAIDRLNMSMVNFANYLDRMIQFLLDPNENEQRLPLMLSVSPGRYAGLAGLGLLSTHLTAEIRRDSHPASVQTIPTNGGNQNIVPMGGIGVVRNKRTICDTKSLLAIFELCVYQSIALLDGKDKDLIVKEDRSLANDLQIREKSLESSFFSLDTVLA